MLLSRLRPKKKDDGGKSKDKRKLPELQEYLLNRDYAGAISVLSFPKGHSSSDKNRDASLDCLWLAYCAFHAGDHKMAADIYAEQLAGNKSASPVVKLYLACCHFYLGAHDEAQKLAEAATAGGLKNRLMFHIAHKKGDENSLMTAHKMLKEQLEDQMCLASVHYLRSHFQEAIDIYKAELLKNKTFVALNVYLALCYYKLDYYDVSLQVLQLYLDRFPDSATAVNLKACNHFKLYNGRSAENELRLFEDQATPTLQFARDVIQHNRVVFAGGERALHTLPSLVEIVPEARLNLIIYYLKLCTSSDLQSSFELAEQIVATTPHEFIIKAVVYVLVGQQHQWKDHVEQAREWFSSVGGSASECDTLPGRQCMAASFFLSRQFGEVLVYLNSIKSYFYTDDTFNYNYGQALALTGEYEEGELALLQVHEEQITSSYAYHEPTSASRLGDVPPSGSERGRLQSAAGHCQRLLQDWRVHFRGESVRRVGEIGSESRILGGQEGESLREVLTVLQTSDHPQVHHISRVMKKWANENKIPID